MGILTSNIPDGYVPAISRRRVWRDACGEVQYTVAHLYKGTFTDIGQPMCKLGYEKSGDISIFRKQQQHRPQRYLHRVSAPRSRRAISGAVAEM